MKKNALLVIGNGFDVACGYKTRYSDFYENDEKELKIAADKGNELCQSILANDKNKYNWSDLESGLYNYSLALTQKYGEGNKVVANKFRKDFIELRELLYKYLKGVYEAIHSAADSSFMRTLYREWEKLSPTIFSFNYTPIAFLEDPKYDEIFRNAQQSGKSRFLFQHGAIANVMEGGYYSANQLVLGIDEITQKVEDLHSFLYKSMQNTISNNQIADSIHNSDIIIIFGCSMGYSDYWYFNQIFNTPQTGKTYLLYTHSYDGFNSLLDKVRLFSGNLANFKRDNSLNIIITSNTNQALAQTQQMINSFI